MGGPVDIPGDQLRTIVERIEHTKKEISELNEGKKEIYQEAKSNGLDPQGPSGDCPLAKARPEGARGARVPARGLSESDQWSSGLQGRLTAILVTRPKPWGEGPSVQHRGPLKLTQAVLINSSCICHVNVTGAVRRRCRRPDIRWSIPQRSISSAPAGGSTKWFELRLCRIASIVG